MKRFFILIALVSLFIGCSESTNKTDAAKVVATAAVKTVAINVEGMTCTGCENTIQESINELPGISTVKADHIAKKATVTYDTTKTTIAAISDKIKNAGYQVMP